MTGSTITGNTSKSVERHIGSSYKVVLAVSKKLDDIVRISDLIENDTYQDVAANLDSIIVVRTDIENVNIVAGTIGDVVVVSSNIDDVVTVSTNVDDVVRVSQSIDEVIRVSQSADNVDRIALSIANLDRVFASIDGIDIVAASIDDVDVVANNIGVVNTVASDILAVTTVSNKINEVLRVHQSIANVDRVSVSADNVDTVASSIGHVDTVSGAIASVNRVNTSITEVERVAASADNVDTVEASIGNVDTVASNVTSVNTTSSNIGSVKTTATNIGSVNTVAGNIASVNNVSTNMTDVLNASSFVDDIHVSVDAAAASASASQTSANESEQSNLESANNAAITNTNVGLTAADVVTVTGLKSDVTTMRNQVESDRSEVVSNKATVSADKADVTTMRNEVETARAEVELNVAAVEAASSAITSASNAAYIQALENMSGSKWTTIIDNFDNSQIVRRIPIHTFEDLNITDCPFTGVLDCFIRQDLTLRPYVDVPVYEASNSGGKAVSQAGKTPWTSIDADTARARSEELNSNSVMISQEIWAMLCWNMISQGFQPRGNTEYGHSHSNKNEFGRRVDGRVPNDRSGPAAYTLTGSGPMEWSHDGTPFGVMDLVGNVWEWVDGMKMVNGQFIVAEYTGQPEAEWVASGVYISETGQFTNSAPSTLRAGSHDWGSMTKASGYTGNERLQRLMIEPIACTSVLGGKFFWVLSGERFPIRGGAWSNASTAGPAALHCYNPRSNASSSFGFRSAFVS